MPREEPDLDIGQESEFNAARAKTGLPQSFVQSSHMIEAVPGLVIGFTVATIIACALLISTRPFIDLEKVDRNVFNILLVLILIALMFSVSILLMGAKSEDVRKSAEIKPQVVRRALAFTLIPFALLAVAIGLQGGYVDEATVLQGDDHESDWDVYQGLYYTAVGATGGALVAWLLMLVALFPRSTRYVGPLESDDEVIGGASSHAASFIAGFYPWK